MMQSSKVIARNHHKPLYTQTLFNYTPDFSEHLQHGLELGRSFVQPKFWGMRSLDYLWYGIGAYLRKYPDIQYLFGPVSLSQSYSEQALNLMVYFYTEYFATPTLLVQAKNEYRFSTTEREAMKKHFSGLDTYQEKFTRFKSLMAEMDESIPTLFKQYTELCEAGGSQFAAFNIDMDFSDCIDGFIIINTHKIKASKRKRYIG